MRFDPLNSRQRFLLALAGIVAIGFGLARITPAQQPHPFPGMDDGMPAHLVAASKGAQVVDITPRDQVWPRYHVLYNLEKNTATLLCIDEDGVMVRGVTRLDRITSGTKKSGRNASR